MLLALAGGFLFAYICEYTRYPSLRGESQQLYFFAAVFAIALLFASRLAIALAKLVTPAGWEQGVNTFLSDFAGPLYSPALPTFSLAFVLGPSLAWLVNKGSDRNKISDNVITTYGQELEKFLYESTNQRRLVYIGLENRKVYVGWAIDMPLPKPRRDASTEHFTILPAKSGYVADDDLKVHFTTQYGLAHDQIANGTITHLSLADFQVLIPLDQMVVVRPFSLDVDPSLFEESSELPEETNSFSPLQTLLMLLMVWRITRKSS